MEYGVRSREYVLLPALCAGNKAVQDSAYSFCLEQKFIISGNVVEVFGKDKEVFYLF